MTGQHDLRVKFLAGQVAILGEHCLVTGCYFEPCKLIPHSFLVINTVKSIKPNS